MQIMCFFSSNPQITHAVKYQGQTAVQFLTWSVSDITSSNDWDSGTVNYLDCFWQCHVKKRDSGTVNYLECFWHHLVKRCHEVVIFSALDVLQTYGPRRLCQSTHGHNVTFVNCTCKQMNWVSTTNISNFQISQKVLIDAFLCQASLYCIHSTSVLQSRDHKFSCWQVHFM